MRFNRFNSGVIFFLTLLLIIFPLSPVYAQDNPAQKNTDTTEARSWWQKVTVGDLAGFLFSAVTGGIPTAVKWAVGNQIADSIPPIQEARQEIMKGAINAIVPVIVPVVAPAVGFVAGAVPGGDSLTHSAIQGLQLLDKPAFGNDGPQKVQTSDTGMLSFDSNGMEARFNEWPSISYPDQSVLQDVMQNGSGPILFFSNSNQTQDYPAGFQPVQTTHGDQFWIDSFGTYPTNNAVSEPAQTTWNFQPDNSDYIDLSNTSNISGSRYNWDSTFYNPQVNLGQTPTEYQLPNYNSDTYNWSF